MITKVSTIDDTTGEVLKDSTFYSDGSTINYNVDSGFKKLYAPLPYFEQNMHFSSWVKLLPYIEYQTNRLVMNSGEKVKIKDIIKIVDMGRSSTYAFIKEANDIYAMKKHKGSYYINPRFAMNGKKINIELINIFKDDEEFKNRIPKHEKGIAYKLLGVLDERTRSQVPC